MPVRYRVLSQRIAKPQGYKAKLALSHPGEPGDTLSKIVQRFYGNANKYPRLFEANREVIHDANLISPGQKSRIPPA